MMVIDNKYTFGDFVYLTTDVDQKKRIVTAFKCFPNGQIVFQLTCGTEVSEHYDFEFTKEEDTVLKTK
jgi:hypothetical protein